MRWIATDGVFSMDGDMAPLDKIVELSKKYNAYVTVWNFYSCEFCNRYFLMKPILQDILALLEKELQNYLML